MSAELVNGGIYNSDLGLYLTLKNDAGEWHIRFLWYGKSLKGEESETGVTGGETWAKETVKGRNSTLLGTLGTLGQVLGKALKVSP